MKYHRSNEKVGMILAAAVAAISIASFVFSNFVLGPAAQPSGLSMISTAAIERAGAKVIVTESPRHISQPNAAEGSRR